MQTFTEQQPGLHSRIAVKHDAIIDDFVILTAGSTGGYGDDRTLGEKAKDALPGTGRGGSTTGHSTGQGYSRDGSLTSGTGKSTPLLALALQPHVEILLGCPLHLESCCHAGCSKLQLAGFQCLCDLYFMSFSLVKCQVCSS